MRHSDLVLLGLLADGPAHGYRLNQQIERMRVRSWSKISQATVYRRLERLEEQGYLEAEEERREGGGASRTVYRVTATGEERLAELVVEALGSEEPPYSDRLVGAAFSTVALSGEKRRERLAAAAERLDDTERRLAERAEAPISPLGGAIVEFYRRVAEAEARLLRRVRSLGGEGGDGRR